MLEKRIGDAGERKASRSRVNTIEGKYLRALQGLTKTESIIITLLRTEVIGLKD